MTRKLLLTAALVTAIGLFAAGAQASPDDARSAAGVTQQGEWMSIASVIQKLEGQGYKVRSIETEHGVYEVEMTDANGMRIETYLNPVTGEPVQRRGHDD